MSLRPMDSACRIAVVVPFYDEQTHLGRCLAHLAQQVDDSGNPILWEWFEIICVDNASTDSSIEVVTEFAQQHPRCSVVCEHEGRRGPGWARRKGIETAAERFRQSGRCLEDGVVAWIDADAEANPHWISAILRLFEDPTVAAGAGDKCYALDLFELVCAQAPHAYLPGIIANLMIETMVETLRPIRTPRINGANAAVRLSNYFAVGGLEQIYYDRTAGLLAPGEEMEFGNRLMANGDVLKHIPVMNYHSPRRVVASWLRSAIGREVVETYSPVFEPTDETQILQNLPALRNVSRQRWWEIFVRNIDGCIKSLVTRDVITAVMTQANWHDTAVQIYGERWQRVISVIEAGLPAREFETGSGEREFVNGFHTTRQLETLTEQVFDLTRDDIWNWLWRMTVVQPRVSPILVNR